MGRQPSWALLSGTHRSFSLALPASPPSPPPPASGTCTRRPSGHPVEVAPPPFFLSLSLSSSPLPSVMIEWSPPLAFHGSGRLPPTLFSGFGSPAATARSAALQPLLAVSASTDPAVLDGAPRLDGDHVRRAGRGECSRGAGHPILVTPAGALLAAGAPAVALALSAAHTAADLTRYATRRWRYGGEVPPLVGRATALAVRVAGRGWSREGE